MGYLQTTSETIHGIQPFSKAVISLWFRVPQISLDIVGRAGDAVDADNSIVDLPLLNRVVPLMTFGASYGENKKYEYQLKSVSSYSWTENTYFYTGGTGPDSCQKIHANTYSNTGNNSKYVSTKVTHPLDTSYIGVYVPGKNDSGYGSYFLTFNMQFSDVPLLNWLTWSSVNGVSNKEYIGGFREFCGIPKPTASDTITYVDDGNSDAIYKALWGAESIGAVSKIKVTPNTWHHLLLSFDFSGTITAHGVYKSGQPDVSSSCKLWVALDDHNYTGNALPAVWIGTVPGSSAAPNTIITVAAKAVTSQSMTGSFPVPNPSIIDNHKDGGVCTVSTLYDGGGVPSYEWSPPSIAINPLGIPATHTSVAGVQACEMAELQMFFGVTMDTGDHALRRMFIKGGKPVDPSGSAIRHLNRDPDILLHGVGNWKQGRNTGVLPVQFQHFGTIKKFKPEPKLGD